VLVDQRGKFNAVLLIEFFCAARIVLRDAEKRNAVAAIALEKALKKRKSELANRARNFKESHDNRAQFQKGRERILLAIQGFQRKAGSGLTHFDRCQRCLRINPAR
jgi:hypothetical protein